MSRFFPRSQSITDMKGIMTASEIHAIGCHHDNTIRPLRVSSYRVKDHRPAPGRDQRRIKSITVLRIATCLSDLPVHTVIDELPGLTRRSVLTHSKTVIIKSRDAP